MGLLTKMFEREAFIAKHFIPINDLLVEEGYSTERQKYLATYIQLLQEEAVEFLRELPARKFWRPSINTKEVDKTALAGELADLWHILIAISLISGFDALDTYALFEKKNEENLERIRNNS